MAIAFGNYGNRRRIVELGAGTASKTSFLLAAVIKQQTVPVDYLPVDVSSTALAEAQATLERLVPGVCIRPQISNYVTEPLILPIFDGCTLVVYIGSSIGNFSREEATSILHHVREQLKQGDALLLGVDMCQDPIVLVPAYNDKNGVSGAFHLNVLRRLNREFGYNFDLNLFRYRVVWNERESRMEKHLESLCSQQVKCIPHFGEETLKFAEGETIHMENSYKFTNESLNTLLINVGFAIEHIWNDEYNWVNVILARVS